MKGDTSDSTAVWIALEKQAFTKRIWAITETRSKHPSSEERWGDRTQPAVRE